MGHNELFMTWKQTFAQFHRDTLRYIIDTVQSRMLMPWQIQKYATTDDCGHHRFKCSK